MAVSMAQVIYFLCYGLEFSTCFPYQEWHWARGTWCDWRLLRTMWCPPMLSRGDVYAHLLVSMPTGLSCDVYQHEYIPKWYNMHPGPYWILTHYHELCRSVEFYLIFELWSMFFFLFQIVNLPVWIAKPRCYRRTIKFCFPHHQRISPPIGIITPNQFKTTTYVEFDVLLHTLSTPPPLLKPKTNGESTTYFLIHIIISQPPFILTLIKRYIL